MSWWVGQQVSVLREAGVFTVKVIEADALQLEDENGFCYSYLQSMVVARQEIQIQQITVKDAQMAQKPKAQKPVSTKENTLPSIDLHAEELGVSPQLPAHDVLLAQLSAFKRFCNLQARSKQTKFLVIHGAGEGRLKQEIKHLVLSRPGIAMHDAQWSNGAVGASRIELVLSVFTAF